MTKNSKLNIIILAAGKGTRMHSNQPKVLHGIGSKAILGHVLDCAESLNPQKVIIVYGYGGAKVQEAFSGKDIIWAEQKEQLGTGHAVQQAVLHLDDDAITLILLGDVPLVNVEACKKLVQESNDKMVIQSFIKPDPTGYGRIIRNDQNLVTAIVEHKDASHDQRKIDEVNTGIMAMPSTYLKKWLKRVDNDNAQKEYYLTDIVRFAVEDAVTVSADIIDDEWSVTGVNHQMVAKSQFCWKN